MSGHDIHKEASFEDDICEHLAAHGWLYDPGPNPHYDRANALDTKDLVAWIQATQPAAWTKLADAHGSSTVSVLADRIRKSLDQRGTLDVLRNGVDLVGLKATLQLAQFKPALALNPELLERYAANRLRVARQVRYSLHNTNCLDLVLLLNGIPVATAELKTDFKQSVTDAIEQYQQDRIPNPKGQAPEPLLSTPRGALVHFAVSNREVHMTTHLAGSDTVFLPFNQGKDGGAGNPPNPDGHPTTYLWERVWARESWLEILGRYLVPKKDAKKQVVGTTFPRFHQLDVTRKLQAAVRADADAGRAGRYLVQHSAGSGKTNSIAWTAHFLSELHDSQHKKVFDSVLVVSDRNVIDSQLQETLFAFERTTGVVARVTGDSGSKSGELAAALSGDKKVVVCTIQTFPFAMKAVRELAATQGKRFCVIADEAHSSQTGEAASKLKQVLSAAELAELADGGEVSTEDLLAATMAARADDRGITFVAFTATPKGKTMELFGTRPDPSRKPANDNVPGPFHVYSMRQAIEEGFILDVLKNYTPYALAFKLTHEGKGLASKEVERDRAMKGLIGWVKLHPYNIAQKVAIIVEHYRQHVMPLLGGKAKAMVVVSSRLEAVRWQLALQKYIAENALPIGTLVAFSGEVNDPESGPDPFTEGSPRLNPTLKGGDLREAFAGPGFHILLVANKFQTGFDQPLLCGMYIDKRLADIQAVQTLSRLNRAYPGKDTTYIVDFANDGEEILAAFKKYHDTAELAATTDPNLVYDLRSKLDAAGYYDENEVERVVKVELDPNAKQKELEKALEPVADRLMKRWKAGRESLAAARDTGDAKAEQEAKDTLDQLVLFKGDLGAYLRAYTFLSQIFDFGNPAIEKRAIFYKALLPLLDFEREREGIDLSKVRLTHHKLKTQGRKPMPLGGGDGPKLQPMKETGTGKVQDKKKALLDEIIARVNDLFSGEVGEDDKLVFVKDVVAGKMLASKTLQEQATSNNPAQFEASPDLMPELQGAIIDALDAHTTMSMQALNSEAVREGLLALLLGPLRLYERLRERAAR